SFPLTDRVVEVDDVAASAAPLTERNGVSASRNGLAVIGVDQIAGGGFDAVTLTAANILPRVIAPGTVAAFGRVRFATTDALDVGRAVTVDTNVIDVSAATASIDAPYVRLGTTGLAQITAKAPRLGANELDVHAALLDVQGQLTVNDAAHVDFHADQ